MSGKVHKGARIALEELNCIFLQTSHALWVGSRGQGGGGPEWWFIHVLKHKIRQIGNFCDMVHRGMSIEHP